MKEMKSKGSAEQMSIEEVNEVVADLEKEKSDREFEEDFNAEREMMAARLIQKGETDV